MGTDSCHTVIFYLPIGMYETVWPKSERYVLVFSGNSILCSRVLSNYYAFSRYYWITQVITELHFKQRFIFYLGSLPAYQRLVCQEVIVEFTCNQCYNNLVYSPDGLKSRAIDWAILPCITASLTTGACCAALHDSTTASM